MKVDSFLFTNGGPPRHPPITLAVVALASRLALLLVAVVANLLIPDHAATGVYRYEPAELTLQALETFTR